MNMHAQACAQTSFADSVLIRVHASVFTSCPYQPAHDQFKPYESNSLQLN